MKKMLLIAIMFAVVLSISVPFAFAADGETKSVQYYDYGGIVLPCIDEIWDKENYPYVAIIGTTDSYAAIYFSNYKTYYSSSSDELVTAKGSASRYYWAVLSGNSYSNVLYGEVQWSVSAPIEGDDVDSVTVSNRSVWANYDITSNAGGVYCSASDPVIDKLVEYETNPAPAAPLYDYGGIVVPDISSCDAYDINAYPYVLLFRTGEQIHLRFFNVPFDIKPSGSYLYIRAAADGQQIKIQRSVNYLLNGYEWGTAEPADIAATNMIKSLKDEDFNDEKFAGHLIWANCDLSDADGFVYYRSVAPIPVDENSEPSIPDNIGTIVDSSTHWINALAAAITGTPFIFAFVLVAFVGISIRIICRLRK